MTAPIFDKDVPIISRSYANNDKDRVAPPRDPPGKDFKKLLQEQEKPKENKKKPFNDVAAGYKKAAEKEVEPDSELDDYSAGESKSESPTGYPTEAPESLTDSLLRSPKKSSLKDNLSNLDQENISESAKEDAYAKSFFGDEEPVESEQDSLPANSESPLESLPSNADIVSLLTKRHDSLEKKANVSLFDLQAQVKSPKSSEQEMAGKKLEDPYQSSFTSSFSKKENKTTAEQTLAAKEGQAVTFTSEDPSVKKIKTGLEAALEAKRRQGTSTGEDTANSKIERKNPHLPTQEGDKNSAGFLAAQSTAGEQPKLTGTAATSAPAPVNQDVRIKELEKIIANLYTVSVDGQTDTSFEIKDPNSLFIGAKITISITDDKPDQFSVTIEHLSVLAKSIVEMHGHQEALRSAFEEKGLTLHNIYATTGTLRDEVPGLAKSDESTRDQKGDEGNRQDRRHKRQQQS